MNFLYFLRKNKETYKEFHLKCLVQFVILKENVIF